MNRRILGGLTAALLAGGLALTTGGAASAVVQSPPDDACYAQVEQFKYERPTVVTENMWAREVPLFETQDKIDKVTRRVTVADPLTWTDWTDAGAASFWDDGRDRGPAKLGGGADGTVGYREYKYIVVDTRQVPAGTATEKTDWVTEVPIGDGWTIAETRGVPGPVETTDWVTEQPAGDGWVQIAEQNVQGERIPCAVEKLQLTFIQECGTFTVPDGPWVAPDNVQWRLRNSNDVPVKYVLRQAGAGEIQSGMLAVGDTFVTLPFGARTLILETYDDFDQKTAQDTKAGGDTFLTTDDDEPKCLPPTPEDQVTYGDWIGEPTCDETEYVQTRTVTTTTYTWDGDKFVGTTTTSEETRIVEVEVVEPCPTTPTTEPPTTEPPTTEPPTTEPPTTEPPTTEPPTTEPPVVTTIAPTVPTTEAVSVQPPTQAPTTTPTAGLPATGSNGAGATALIALLVTSLGGAATLVSRRRTVTG